MAVCAGPSPGLRKVYLSHIRLKTSLKLVSFKAGETAEHLMAGAGWLSLPVEHVRSHEARPSHPGRVQKSLRHCVNSRDANTKNPALTGLKRHQIILWTGLTAHWTSLHAFELC
ncbi:hypothetical protein MITS9509_01649 [Synechococcus sp. MIT S9509]|nr:hypothetical protein MITS9509_01649 [Synechococcus sp. MIT S9509]